MILQKKKMKHSSLILFCGALAFTLSSCYDPTQKADSDNLMVDNTGVEYAPQMYHSEPYDPMSQVVDTTAGLQYFPWNEVGTSSELDGKPHGEWFNSNYWNPHGMNMRQPASNTIMRGAVFTEWPDSLDATSGEAREYADVNTTNSFVEGDISEDYLGEGKVLFGRFCSHCHGAEGKGDGLVAEKFAGVANLQGASMKKRNAGYVYHVISHGKNSMRSHAAQLDEAERWKIAEYVIRLKK